MICFVILKHPLRASRFNEELEAKEEANTIIQVTNAGGTGIVLEKDH